jgi:hypothetical protein
LYWAAGGRGFPYAPDLVAGSTGPLAGRLGLAVAWAAVLLPGLSAAGAGVAMLLGVKRFRLLLISAGVLLAGVLLLLMTDITLLVTAGYIPYALLALLKGSDFGQSYMKGLMEWSLLHQVLCLTGGFLWLASTLSYARRSGEACLYCGRSDRPKGWTQPEAAGRWGRAAVAVALVAPVFYALTRYAWALGMPLGISAEDLRRGQESGMWTSGLFLGTFALVGAALMLGLVQRWGEVFPRWLIGLAGRRVPIALAVVPAAIVSVLLVVGGISIWSNYAQMSAAAAASGQALWVVVGPTLLFPVWGAALAVAALGYYYRRRGACRVCGRGASAPLVTH